ncbi:hypothetical protein [Frankia sp. CiP1_Cm_nod2]|uniref:hypothetical protein n=1 Tax=Frankia sp. CiP1_Cm_nod2 TaxID=2897161 RepID=UPI0020242453
MAAPPRHRDTPATRPRPRPDRVGGERPQAAAESAPAESSPTGASGDTVRSAAAGRPGGFPALLGVAVVCWLIVGFTTLWAGMDALAGDPDQRTAQDLSDRLGEGTVRTTEQVQPQDLLALGVGTAILAALAALLLRRWWAQHVLQVLAVVAVIVLAAGAHWEAVLVFFAFVIGAIMLLTESTRNHLRKG